MNNLFGGEGRIAYIDPINIAVVANNIIFLGNYARRNEGVPLEQVYIIADDEFSVF